jgi:PAS domain S-box-containing protein
MVSGRTNLERAAILAAAVDDAPICVFVADVEMRYVAVNAYACELLGYTEAELLDMRVSDIAAYEQAPTEFSTMVAHAYMRGVSRLRTKDGEELLLTYVAGAFEVGGEQLYVSAGLAEFVSGE